jgi:DNA-binding CsgD family transcriptional regulator
VARGPLADSAAGRPAARRDWIDDLKWPLVGREDELAFAGRLVAERRARGVVLSGAAGVGKTRLAAELSQIAASSGYAVEWIRATRSAASIPLGAFAALLRPPGAGSGAGADLLALARHTLLERAGGRRLGLWVDDGDMLDDGSAALVHQLVAAGEAFALVTIRRDARAPDAVAALWKDEMCARLDVAELERPAVERLLGEVLGGPVDGRSAAQLWQMTRGNVLFLRELVLYGVEKGALVADGGIWRWRGELTPGMRMGELIGARLVGLEPPALGTLEVVVVGAPLEVGLLDPSETAALEALERHGILEYAAEGRRRYAELAHPLHGEVVRAGLPRARVEAIQRRLAATVQACGARRRGDVLRMAAWRLEAGGAAPAELFVRAAEQALAVLDWSLATRFAQAAVREEGGFPARLALARAHAGAGRAVEAEELLGALEREALADADRAGVAVARARNLFWGLDRSNEASAVLLRAEQALSDPRLPEELIALRARLASAEGRPLVALAAARPLLKSPRLREPARLRAAIATSEALWQSGRTREAISVAERWEPVARRDELPLIEAQLISERVFALWLAGRLVDATDVAEHLYELDLARRSAQNTAVAALTLGVVWHARGKPRTALRWFGESATLLRDADTIGMRRWALAGSAMAAAQSGDASAARHALQDMEDAPRMGTALFGPELQLARAWSAAAAGELSRARSLAGVATELAEARGQDGLAVRALHELARLGEPTTAAPRLAALAARVDGPFAGIAAAHAAALRERDGGALLEVSERFVTQSAPLLAAEAASAAAAAHREAGRGASARAAAARTAVLLDDCEGARTPPLLDAHTDALDELTRREREIAALAASGLSSREIALRLVVSVRTVDNHLQRAYRKLGISRRDQLSGLITPPTGVVGRAEME